MKGTDPQGRPPAAIAPGNQAARACSNQRHTRLVAGEATRHLLIAPQSLLVPLLEQVPGLRRASSASSARGPSARASIRADRGAAVAPRRSPGCGSRCSPLPRSLTLLVSRGVTSCRGSPVPALRAEPAGGSTRASLAGAGPEQRGDQQHTREPRANRADNVGGSPQRSRGECRRGFEK